MTSTRECRHFPASAGILFGLGLGGFFDGIVLHQVLQWHHMVTSAGYPPTTVENLKLNTLLDGLFHADHVRTSGNSAPRRSGFVPALFLCHAGAVGKVPMTLKVFATQIPRE
jgi:hypothetical protein